MFFNYVYSQQPSYLMEFKCNLHIITCGILTVNDFWSCKR